MYVSVDTSSNNKNISNYVNT